MGCRHVQALLHRRGADLAEADVIVLEDHLEGCAPCAAIRDRLLLARELVAGLPHVTLGPAARQRAFANAMLAGARAAPRSAVSWWVGGAIAALVATAVVGWLVVRDPAASAPAEVARGVEVHTPSATRLALPAVTFTTSADTRFTVAPDARAIDLHAGRLEVEVDPRAALAFRVVTATFVVEVTGTKFQVDGDGVVVTRGSVRVVDRAGAILDAAVTAGEAWTEPPPVVATAPALLERVRGAFATGSCAGGAQLVDELLATSPPRATAAEARMLAAECAQGSGRLDEAVRAFDDVALQYPELAAAQSAAMAAARIALDRGQRGDARARLTRYLARYPAGSFAADARRALSSLGGAR